MTLENPRPLKEPYPDWYNANSFCQYHHVNIHDIKRCTRLRHEIQDHIEESTICLNGSKQNANKLVVKENSELQIYTDPFSSHFANLIIDPSDSTTQPSAYVNMVMITPSIGPEIGSPDVTFTLQDMPLNHKPSPLYILARLNGNIVTVVLVDPVSLVNVITKETLWLNSLQREYKETKSTIHTHDGISLKSYGSIILSVLVGPRPRHR